jgi:hypothetical protein
MRSIQSTVSMAKLKLTTPGFHQVRVAKEGMQFQRLSLLDAGVSTEVGKPEVPIMRRFVALPPGANATVRVTTGATKTMEGMLVFPTQPPVKDQAGTEPPFTMDRAFYAQDVSYPPEVAVVSTPMMLGKQRVALLEVAPMQYNPARKQLTVFQDVDVEVSFTRPARALAPSPAVSEATKRLGTAAIVNPELIAAIAAATEPWDYLIISADQFLEELEPLINWKRSKGLKVHLARISYVGNTPAQIQNFVRAAFDNHGTRYVLLVGDVDTITTYTFAGSDGTSIPSDYYYSLVSGTDLLPDVAIGRFSARTEAEVTNMVSKSVSYEQSPFTPSLDWYKKAVFVSDTDSFEPTSDWCAAVASANGYTVDKFYRSLGNATASNVASAINGGRAIVNYRGHGSATGWSTSGFSNTNIASLTNGRMMPVVFSVTCETGHLDYSSDCFTETFLKRFASGPQGAVAVWGASRPSWRSPNNELDKGAFDALLNLDIHPLGEVTNSAKLYCITALGTGASVQDNLYMYNLFGDPSLNVWTSRPLLAARPRLVRPMTRGR